MFRTRFFLWILVFLASSGLFVFAGASVASQVSGSKKEAPILYIYNWANYLPEVVLQQFQAETGIRVYYDVFDSPEVLEAKLLAARSGYDVVFPSAWPDLARQIPAGVYLPLDFSKIPNSKLLDTNLMKKLTAADPGNRFAVPYLWGTTGFVYNVNALAAAFPDAPVESLRMLFDPKIVRTLAQKGCRVTLLDSPIEVFSSALTYLSQNPVKEDVHLLGEAVKIVQGVSPFISKFDSSQFMNQIATGEICVAQTWSSYGNMAKQRAAERKDSQTVRYVIPSEGSFIWFDLMAIPMDAPHPNNAHRFINFILRPEIIAKITNLTRSPNAVPASAPYIQKDVLEDEAIYPPREVQEKLKVDVVKSRVYERKRLRAWTKVKTGY
ncbi:MAG: extracellular solute-binding protein [Alphaproteobacteria bacterium]